MEPQAQRGGAPGGWHGGPAPVGYAPGPPPGPPPRPRPFEAAYRPELSHVDNRQFNRTVGAPNVRHQAPQAGYATNYKVSGGPRRAISESVHRYLA